MENISRHLKSPVKNNTVIIPESIGTGFIKNLLIENEFCIRYFKFTLNQDLNFNWLNESNNEAIFKLISYLENSDHSESVTKAGNSQSYKTENSTILYSTDFARKGIISKNTVVNRVVLLFTKNWLEENFNEASDRIFELVCQLVKKNKPTFIIEQMHPGHMHITGELADELCQDKFPLIHIKTKGLIILNSFLNKLVSENPDNLNISRTLFYPEIKKVESRLQNYFDKAMPNIAEIASEFNMSSTTLQRHFKIVYGKTIYSYYLEKKLALGKSLIKEKNKTISEIAYSLGYNKTNSFSKAFKKHYGILPKEVNYLPLAS